MDIMSIKSSLLRGLVSKILSKQISKQLGCKVNIRLDDIEVSYNGDEANVHADVNLNMDSKEFTKLLDRIK